MAGRFCPGVATLLPVLQNSAAVLSGVIHSDGGGSSDLAKALTDQLS